MSRRAPVLLPSRDKRRKPAAERKRKSLTFRIRDDLRSKLVKWAGLNERSISEEIAHRLTESFLQQDLQTNIHHQINGLFAKNMLEYERRMRIARANGGDWP